MKVFIGPYPKRRWYHRLFGLDEGGPKVKVTIDDYDTWNVDSTIGHIMLPLLKRFKELNNGAPFVENKDVPPELRATDEEIEYTNKTGDTDDKHFDRWDYVLDEMIFAFESLYNDWELEFWDDSDDWKDSKIDMDGRLKYHKRVQNGFRLFGKYLTNIWW